METTTLGPVAPGNTHLIVVHFPAGRMATFRGLGWVALEASANEQAARARFHALKPAFEGLEAAAVLMKAVVHPDMKVEGVRAFMSKDAEFWRLKGAEIGVASREQVDEWQTAAAELVALGQAEALARRPGQRKAEPSAGYPVWAVTAACAVVAVGLSVAAAVRFSAAHPPEASRGNSIFLSDPRDPNIVVEYAIAEDGLPRAVRRMHREELEPGAAKSPSQTDGAAKPKTLADGINVFLRVRQ